MVSKQVGAIFAILGGVFYIIGSFLGAFLAVIFAGLYAGLSGAYLQNPAAGISYSANAAMYVFGLGVVSGGLIIVGGALLNSDSPDRRKSGGILAIVMMIVGAIPTLGGAVIGFFFTLLGGVIGLTYKGEPDIIIGSVPMPPASQPAGSGGPLKFCIKCGLALHAGAVYCGSCGAPIPQG